MISAEEFLSGHESVIADCELESGRPEKRAKDADSLAQGNAARKSAQDAADPSLRHVGSFGALPDDAASDHAASGHAELSVAGPDDVEPVDGAGAGTASSYGLHGSHDSHSADRGRFGRSGFRGSRSRKRYGAYQHGRDSSGVTVMESSRQRRRLPDDPQDLDACREAALTLLDAAARSSGALRTRLLGKGYAADIVEEVIERLGAVGLIDDRSYAQSAVRYCVERMYGRRGAVNELVRKGVEGPLAAEIVDEADKHGAFEESAWELGRSIERKTRGLDRQVRMRRLWSAGGRKGHDPAMLRVVAHELFDVGADGGADVAGR